MRRALFLLLLCPFFAQAQDLFGTLTAKSKVRLLVETPAAKPGDTVWAGVHFTIPEHWHIYWRNHGESGAAPKILWQLPAGITAGDIHWPVPEKLIWSELTTYVYHGQVLLMVPLKLTGDLKPQELVLRAKVDWLECHESCVDGTAAIQAPLVVGDKTTEGNDAPLFARTRQQWPVPATAPLAAWWSGAEKDGKRLLTFRAPAAAADTAADFLPYLDSENRFEVQPAGQGVITNGTHTFTHPVKKLRGDWPVMLAGVVRVVSAGNATRGIETTLMVGEKPADVVTPAAPALGGMALLLMVAGAFAGGLILNIMPCVLPVISLKILGFVQQSAQDPAHVRRHGLVYGLGVLFSLLVLAGVVIGARQAGGSGSWGMQMQHPGFLLGLLVVMTLVALNLFGVFEVMLGAGAMTKAGELAGREGFAGSFFNGMLATALATPCTAPGLAAAAGVAFVQPPWVIVLFFSAVGVGLALPYVLLSFKPGWLRFLPPPGPWMEQCKQAMGFPMLAAAVWLLTLAAPHFDNGALRLGLMSVVLALAAWVFGQFVQRGQQRRGLAAIVCLLLLGLSVGCLVLFQDKLEWKPWSHEAVTAARAAKRPVLVDFTADWCLTCKVNKRTSIEVDSVRRKLKAVDAVILKADFTDRKNEAIRAELAKHQRAGVPLVLVYPADGSSPPIVLPEILTPSVVVDALQRAAAKP
ncbi:MAG: DUF255 domain-containing protein [Pedosphaera sp.]|nr:DUF255 domain-containing protein [Pedosphaera sp.]MSU43680.1 DUF255 domain-containing protein [Pedosphaera sp.]